MKEFNLADCFNDVLTYGFYAFSAKEILDKIDDKILFSKDHPNYFPAEGLTAPYDGPSPSHRAIFELAERLIGQTYGFNKTGINVCRYWTNGGERIEDWHSDTCETETSYEFALNCYFDDSSDDAGVLQYKPVGSTDAADVYSYVPKRGDIVVLNHTKNFLHRITPPNKDRRVLVIVGEKLADLMR